MKAIELVVNAYTLREQMKTSTGHFYYAKRSSSGNKRRKELADELYKLGLR